MNRITELDAFRGLAAMAVVFSHALMMLPEIGGGAQPQSSFVNLLSTPPLRVFWAGNEAVVLFFVLSGFVLSLPFYKGQVKTRTFLIKRLVRIYPAYIATVFLSLLAYYWLSSIAVSGYSDWFQGVWPESISTSDLIGHVLLIGSFDNDALNPVLWTLVMEMRIALVFPMIMWVIVKFDWRVCVGFALAAYFAGRGLHWYTNQKLGFSNDYFLTLMFVYQFVAGALLARHYDAIVKAVSSLGKTPLWLLFVVGISLLQYSWFFGLELQGAIQRALGQFPTTLGVAVLIVLACSNNNVRKILRGSTLQFLGKISYSLYLIHAIVLVSFVHLFNDSYPYWIIAPAAIGSSLFLALMLYVGVEKPAMVMSRSKLSTPKPLAAN